MRDEHTAACAATRLVCHLHGPCQVPQLQLRHCGALMALDKRRIQRHGRLGIPRRVGPPPELEQGEGAIAVCLWSGLHINGPAIARRRVLELPRAKEVVATRTPLVRRLRLPADGGARWGRCLRPAGRARDLGPWPRHPGRRDLPHIRRRRRGTSSRCIRWPIACCPASIFRLRSTMRGCRSLEVASSDSAVGCLAIAASPPPPPIRTRTRRTPPAPRPRRTCPNGRGSFRTCGRPGAARAWPWPSCGELSSQVRGAASRQPPARGRPPATAAAKRPPGRWGQPPSLGGPGQLPSQSSPSIASAAPRPGKTDRVGQAWSWFHGKRSLQPLMPPISSSQGRREGDMIERCLKGSPCARSAGQRPRSPRARSA